uniref:Uncharacterized protein n=1 Tax=Knipowitschia caucasica TaxID=637954 RepID=A0AAV2MH32_KNICA
MSKRGLPVEVIKTPESILEQVKKLEQSDPRDWPQNNEDGEATLISGAVNYEHISEHRDKEGRYVMITGKSTGKVLLQTECVHPTGH